MAEGTTWKNIKKGLGFKRLFWRIFLTFWIASLAVMATTGYVLINEYTSTEYNQRFFNDVTAQAERIVWRYEHEVLVDGKAKRKIKEWIRQRENRGGQLIPMLVYNAKGEPIYHYRMNKVPSEQRIEQHVYGPSNTRYTVLVRQPQAPRMYKQVLYRFQSIQFVLIFVACALVSALLSWTIVKPITYLGAFSRRYANDQTIAPLPAPLLARGDELGDLATDINFMVGKTHEAASAQQRLLHDVSHELRAPLARLQASAALIEQNQPDNRHVKQIHNDCHRIDQLIQQILNFSTLENAQPEEQVCDIAALCERILDDMAINYPGIPTVLTPPKGTQKQRLIRCYPEAIHQALDNIIGNACKYSDKGQPVSVAIESTSAAMLIKVTDKGPGVDEKEIEKLMQPFYRAGNQMHTEGFGLGLSIALKAIKKHGGSLTMQSPSEGGLCVEVSLPRHGKKTAKSR